MFGRKRSKQGPAPAPEAPARTPADDIKDIKAWITEIASPKFKDLTEREQRNRDGLTDVNNQCKDGRDKTQKLWIEKDAEKQARDLEIADLRKTIRTLRTELAGKANRAKSAPGKKPGA